MAARESGTVAGTNPTTTIGQTGRLLKFVNWVDEAWLQIQNHRADWDWMRADFSQTISSASDTYTAEGDWSLTRFGVWVQDDYEQVPVWRSMSMYKTSEGVSDEQPLVQISWRAWKEKYDRGSQTADRPLEWAITPAKAIAFGPTPDAGYTVRGEFFHRPNTMTANADEPELPVQFHPLIAWWAVVIAHGHDEAAVTGPALTHAKDQKAMYLSALENRELPGITVGGPPIA